MALCAHVAALKCSVPFVAFQDGFRGLDPLIAYSVKASSNLALLRALGRQGAGADPGPGRVSHQVRHMCLYNRFRNASIQTIPACSTGFHSTGIGPPRSTQGPPVHFQYIRNGFRVCFHSRSSVSRAASRASTGTWPACL